MLLFSSSRGALLGLWVSLLLTMSFCYSEPETVEVVGMVECTDCKQMNIMSSQAFSGLRVTVDCKFRDQESKAWGMGHPNERGKFKVSLPPKIAADERMKEDCTGNLQNAFGTPCPVKSSKIIFADKGKRMLGLAGKLKFSLVTCDSKFIKTFSPPAPFYKTLLSQATLTVYIPRPPPLPTLYPPLPQPVPDLEPTTPPLPVPPVLNLEPTSPPLPPPVPRLEPTSPTLPLPPPFPHLEPTTPPPAPTLENPFPPPNATPAQTPPSPTPAYEMPDPLPPVGEPLPPQAPMSNETPPPPIQNEKLEPPTYNIPLSPHSPTSYEPSLPPAYCR